MKAHGCAYIALAIIEMLILVAIIGWLVWEVAWRLGVGLGS